MEQRARLSIFVLIALTAVPPLLTGCGMVGPPQPPSLYLPQPPSDLTAVRTGNNVHLHWTMPKRATDRVLLKGDQAAHICRSVAGGACEAAGDAKFAPLAPADFTDSLPAALASGQTRLITYTVELRNHSGHTAGPSNPAYSASGTAPAPAAAFGADTQPDGILLRWHPVADSSTLIRIQRTLVSVDKEQAKPNSAFLQKGSAVPPEQTLEVNYASGHDPARAFDKSAAFDKTYRYTAQRIAVLNLDAHPVEIASEVSAPVTLNARDVFPPAVPTGLVAVASPDEHAIDLSWSPNTENDLAGYIVYRRDTASQSPPVRISPATPLPGPAFRDPAPRPGVRYAYSVSAIDQDGNESLRCPETQESLPQ